MTTVVPADSTAPKKVVFDDPHGAAGNMQEAEVTRVRTLRWSRDRLFAAFAR